MDRDLQAMQEEKALSSRGRGRLRGFLELRRPWGFSPEARRGTSTGSLASQRHPGKFPKVPGRRRGLEKEMATHSSTLAWKIPWTEEPGGL